MFTRDAMQEIGEFGVARASGCWERRGLRGLLLLGGPLRAILPLGEQHIRMSSEQDWIVCARCTEDVDEYTPPVACILGVHGRRYLLLWRPLSLWQGVKLLLL